MTAFAVLAVMLVAAGALGYVVGRHRLGDDDETYGRWLPRERRRWRP